MRISGWVAKQCVHPIEKWRRLYVLYLFCNLMYFFPTKTHHFYQIHFCQTVLADHFGRFVLTLFCQDQGTVFFVFNQAPLVQFFRHAICGRSTDVKHLAQIRNIDLVILIGQ
jgi:hypothetical protein